MIRWTFVTAALAVLALSGCESTQDKSARLEKEGKSAVNEKGLEVTKKNAAVKVTEQTAISDENGAAVAVLVENKSSRPLVDLPISIDVKDAKGTSLFKNDDPGVERSLVAVPYVKPHGTVIWVNDQVLVSTRPASIAATVGNGKKSSGKSLPKITISGVRYHNDPIEGNEALGTITNHSKIAQRKLVLFGIARKDGKIVAAGRAQVSKLKAGKHKKFHLFFIGNPKGAKITIDAPPTTFK